jgi:hypothetical protein
VIVEIKSCRQDFLTDRKWPEYVAYADRFYFAVAPGFPEGLLPEEEGLILADRFEGALIRPAQDAAARPGPAQGAAAELRPHGGVAAALSHGSRGRSWGRSEAAFVPPLPRPWERGHEGGL